ncbi:MAG TPA: helical backbone metal receptor, partial [Nitrospirales bacterium]|nr:helical backbone metal receptor [Nitrospirales bacterium]
MTLTAWIAAALVALLSPTAFAEDQTMARRQQGILTGMPFMANLAQRTFVDDLGRKVFLAKPPTRVVSLAPSVTEMLFAIGAGEQVIAVTPFCDYPPEAAQKPKIGYTRPSLESLIALHPDLIVAPHEFIRSDLLSKLEEAKVPVFILDAKVIEDIASHLQTL